VINAIFYNNTFVGNLTTHTYIFPSDVPSQPKNVQDLSLVRVDKDAAIKGILIHTI
jgi:hypothetical protein